MAGHREDLHLTPYFASDRSVLALLSNRATMRIVRQNLSSLLDTDEHLAFLLQAIARHFGSAIETG
jgi:3-dehydroquinate synthase class II